MLYLFFFTPMFSIEPYFMRKKASFFYKSKSRESSVTEHSRLSSFLGTSFLLPPGRRKEVRDILCQFSSCFFSACGSQPQGCRVRAWPDGSTNSECLMCSVIQKSGRKLFPSACYAAVAEQECFHFRSSVNFVAIRYTRVAFSNSCCRESVPAFNASIIRL